MAKGKYNWDVSGAQGDLAKNRAIIESTARGLPSGRNYSRSTTASRGYVSMKSKFPGKCQTCQKPIPEGRQVRYWFNNGITCRTCEI